MDFKFLGETVGLGPHRHPTQAPCSLHGKTARQPRPHSAGNSGRHSPKTWPGHRKVTLRHGSYSLQAELNLLATRLSSSLAIEGWPCDPQAVRQLKIQPFICSSCRPYPTRNGQSPNPILLLQQSCVKSNSALQHSSKLPHEKSQPALCSNPAPNFNSIPGAWVPKHCAQDIPES